MGRAESKFQNAALKMINAFIELLEEKEFQQISVSEVCEKAGVNRSTFYAHYNNTYDLLEEIHTEFTKDMNEHFVEDDNGDISPSISVPQLVAYLEYIKGHKNFFKSYMTNLNNFRREDFYSIVKKKVIFPLLSKKDITNPTTAEYISQFYLQGIAAVIREWIYSDCNEDVNYIAETIVLSLETNLAE